MQHRDLSNMMDSVWKERVCIETAEYIISGFIYMPKIGKRNRLLSEVLNSNKSFIAVKDCKMESKICPQKEIAYHDFIQVNTSSILIMRPLDEN